MAHPLIDSDVYNRIGGQANLVQLLDKAGVGDWDATMLDLAMGDAWNFTVAAVGVQVELAGLTNDQIRTQYPHLITISSQKSLSFVWLAATGGQALPDGIKTIDTLADQQLQMLAERRRKHGAVGVNPPISQAVGQIDNNPCGERMTLRGFRATGGLI
jgi:hypothetical protein